MSATSPSSDPETRDRTRARWNEWIDRTVHGLSAVSAAAVSLILVIVCVWIVKEALPLLLSPEARAAVPLGSVLELSGPWVWQPISHAPRYALLPMVAGSLKVSATALAVAVPTGVACAVYLAEVASPAVRRVCRPALELLAGVPPVVLGALALTHSSSWVQAALGLSHRLNGLTAGLTLGVTLIPVIYSVIEDSLRALPRALRETSLALGAGHVATIRRVLLPAAAPGIGAAVWLATGRSLGECMVALMVSGNAALFSWDPTAPTRTLPATVAAELGEVVWGSAHYTVLFLIGLILLGVALVANTAAQLLLRRYRQRSGVI